MEAAEPAIGLAIPSTPAVGPAPATPRVLLRPFHAKIQMLAEAYNFKLESMNLLVVAGRSRRYGMAPTHAMHGAFISETYYVTD